MTKIGAKHTDGNLGIGGVNPNYAMDEKWMVNCQRCVPAFEARLRGYDVTAKPSDGNDDGIRFFKDAICDIKACRGGKLFKKDAEAIVLSSPIGSRFLVRIKWANGGGAHFFMARNVDKNVVYEDPQDPKKDAREFFNNAGAGVGKNWILRIDNREFTDAMSDAVSIV